MLKFFLIRAAFYQPSLMPCIYNHLSSGVMQEHERPFLPARKHVHLHMQRSKLVKREHNTSNVLLGQWKTFSMHFFYAVRAFMLL